VCHIIRSHGLFDRYFGPRFFVRIAGLEMHPKDILDRTEQTRDDGGLGYCNVPKCYTRGPSGAHPDQGERDHPPQVRVADTHWEPLRWVGRKMFGNHDNDTPDADTGSGGMDRAMVW
jgi:succinate dehydrogenase / fumarate reductase, iron-sulfur subunit